MALNNSKHFTFEAVVEWQNGSWKHEAALKCAADTQLSDIVGFLRDVEAIVSRVKEVYKRHGDTAAYELHFCEWKYEPYTDTVDNFDHWVSERSGDISEEGIYFTADEKYTKPERDMFISFDDPIKYIIYTLH